MLATGDANGSTYLWKVGSAGSGPTATLADPSGQGVQAVAFSPDGQNLCGRRRQGQRLPVVDGGRRPLS